MVTLPATVKELAIELEVWQRIVVVIQKMGHNWKLLEQVGEIPVRKSSSTRRLGVYVSIGSKPVCIRLQLAQEPDILPETFLHEVAHACDHLTRRFKLKGWRGNHGVPWKNWAAELGISTARCGESSLLNQLHQQRLKLVAKCLKCGDEIHRVRRLNRNRNYIHKCGGKIEKY